MKYFSVCFIAIIVFFVSFVLISKQVNKQKLAKLPSIELKYEDNISLTYTEVIEAYQILDKKYRQAKLITYGGTDSGHPLHLFVISKSGDFSPESLREKGYNIVMVNNGIHPGEPCGIDASIKLARDILEKNDGLWDVLDSTVLCIVPVYNIGGALNRSQYNRTNQNGPEEQGFRANARNLDLNRDYAPMTSRNARSFAQIFHHWKPHLLIDTHTTNGADYQYVMTLIPTHPQELPPMLGSFYNDTMEPFLYQWMERSGYEMIPYVSPMGQTPESGLQQYYNPPRYTTGYGRLFNTISFMTEAHMFKPYRDRVLATYHFLIANLNFTNDNGSEIRAMKQQADEYVANKSEFVLHWELDTTRVEKIEFKGFEAEMVDSEITGGKRLQYRRDKPFTKKIPYYRHYNPTVTVTKPDYYVIPQAWEEVIHRLAINDVDFKPLREDTLMLVDAYYIESYKSRKTPFNGNFLHYDIKLRTEQQQVQLYAGDIIIHTNQPTNEYIIQMLEPLGYDSYFVWNFFDPILQRKEYFSPYVFEDFAKSMLDNDENLREEFDEKRRLDQNFATNSYAQLLFLYERSPYFEKGYMRYPVFRSIGNLHKN